GLRLHRRPLRGRDLDRRRRHRGDADRSARPPAEVRGDAQAGNAVTAPPSASIMGQVIPEHAMAKQRISYVPLDKMTPEMRAEMERCARMGTPRPESSAVRAHVPGAFWSFANSWRDIFHTGVCDHSVKELCRLYVSRSGTCESCGNQRSIKAAERGTVNEAKVDALMDFEKSGKYSE